MIHVSIHQNFVIQADFHEVEFSTPGHVVAIDMFYPLTSDIDLVSIMIDTSQVFYVWCVKRRENRVGTNFAAAIDIGEEAK